MEHRAARHVHLDRPAGIPRGGDGKERNDQRSGDTTRDPDVRVDAAEEHRIRVEEKLVAEDCGQCNGQRLDRPAHLLVRTAVELLDERQPEHCKPEAQRELAPRRNAERGGERQRFGQRDCGQQRRNRDDLRPARRRARRELRLRAAHQRRDEREPRRVAQRIDDIDQQERRRGRRVRREYARARPHDGCDDRGHETHRARTARPAERDAHGERDVEQERYAVAPGRCDSDRGGRHRIRLETITGCTGRPRAGYPGGNEVPDSRGLARSGSSGSVKTRARRRC